MTTHVFTPIKMTSLPLPFASLSEEKKYKKEVKTIEEEGLVCSVLFLYTEWKPVE